MNKQRLMSLFWVLGLGFGSSGIASTKIANELQEKRTTSINWPPIQAKRVAEASIPSEIPVEPPPKSNQPKRFKVLVDVGHGGHDIGAVGHFGIQEKALCLHIARNVKNRLERIAKLQDFPVEIRMSRDADKFIPLRERVKAANQWSADLFVSIHANSSPVPRARGFEVYFLSNEASDAEASRIALQENGEATGAALSPNILSILSDVQTNAHILESSRFAESVYATLSERLRPNGKGVRQAPFTVLSGTEMPALLIEVGYLTNPEEASMLNKKPYQMRISSGISEGILSFAMVQRRVGKLLPLRNGKRTT